MAQSSVIGIRTNTVSKLIYLKVSQMNNMHRGSVPIEPSKPDLASKPQNFMRPSCNHHIQHAVATVSHPGDLD
jgi:hypothetical protein